MMFICLISHSEDEDCYWASVTTEEAIQIGLWQGRKEPWNDPDDDTSGAEDAADDVPGVEPGTTIDMDEDGTERHTV